MKDTVFRIDATGFSWAFRTKKWAFVVYGPACWRACGAFRFDRFDFVVPEL